MPDANIRAVITAKDEASAALKKFGDNAHNMGSKVADIAKVAAVGIAAAGTAAVGFGIHALKAFDEAEKGIAQTNAVIASTKGVAGVTAKAVDDLSKALEKSTTFSDEEVRSAENLLLTFTAIGKDIFPQATKTVLNMATALGEDTKSASIQLGKALQDPILGVTALRRVGVNFSDAQRDVIKNLVETGRSAEAQQMILKELETEFGNSAEAARHTFGGSLKALKNQINNVEEAVGATIKNALQPFVQKAADFVAAVNWETVINKSKEALRSLWQDRIVPIIERIKFLADIVAAYLQPKLEALWHSIQDNLLPTLLRLWHEVLEPLMPVIGALLVGAIGLAIDALNLFLKILMPVTNWMLDHKVDVIAMATAFGILALALNFSAIVSAFNAAINSAIVTMNVLRLVTIPSALTSLSQFAAGFGPVGIAAVAAAAVIVDAGNKAKAAWDQAAQSVRNAADSDDQVIKNLQNLSKTGTPEQQQRAKATLSKLSAGGNFALGTDFAPGGISLVGEQGPELVNLPRGSQVIPNNKINQQLGSQVNLTVNVGVYAGSQMEKRKLAEELMNAFNDLQRARGMA